jgi:hypothetical protein
MIYPKAIMKELLNESSIKAKPIYLFFGYPTSHSHQVLNIADYHGE